MNTTLFKSSKLHLALVAALGVTLAACGGNSTGSGTAALGGVVKGKAVDGYLNGAAITLDKNDNGICGDTVGGIADISVTSDVNGNFQFNTSDGSHLICASGGTDITTGKPFVGQIQAPPGSTQITPLTNLIVQQFQAANPGVPMVSSTGVINAGVAAAQNTVQTNLGIAAGTNVLTTDPTTNTALSATTTAVQQLVQQITTALASAAGVAAPTAAQQTALYANVAKQVTALVAAAPAGTPINLASTSVATTLAASAVTASVPALGTSLGVAQPNVNATNLSNIVAASVGQTVQSIAFASSASAIAAASTNAVTNAASAVQATVAANTANITAPAGSGLTGILLGSGTGFSGASGVVAASAVVAGGIKSATVVGPLAGAGVGFGVASGVPTVNSALTIGFDVTEALPGTRRLQGIVTGLTEALTGGIYSVNATAATATIYGVTSTGASANATLSASSVISTMAAASAAAPAGLPAASSVGGIQLNIQAMLNLVKGANATFANLNTLSKGTFNVTVVASGIQSLANQAGTALVPTSTIAVSGTTATVTGQGETVSVTVQ